MGFAPVLPGNEARSDHDSAAVLQSKAEEHAPRALVLHVTRMEDDRVSARDGTATIDDSAGMPHHFASGAPQLDVQTDIPI